MNNNKDNFGEIKKELKLGATGRFPSPQGKLNPTDEGELRSALVKKGDTIYIIFGKPVEWLALSRKRAKELGKLLISKSEEP